MLPKIFPKKFRILNWFPSYMYIETVSKLPKNAFWVWRWLVGYVGCCGCLRVPVSESSAGSQSCAGHHALTTRWSLPPLSPGGMLPLSQVDPINRCVMGFNISLVTISTTLNSVGWLDEMYPVMRASVHHYSIIWSFGCLRKIWASRKDYRPLLFHNQDFLLCNCYLFKLQTSDSIFDRCKLD